MPNSVLVVGSIALDDIETPSAKKTDVIGGSAIYFSIAASFFTNVKVVGVAGKDFPEETIEMMNNHNIDTNGIELKEGETFKWGGKYRKNMDRRDTLYTNLNVFKEFSPKLPEEYKDTPYVFLGNIQPSLQLDVLDQLNDPKFVALDTMNLWINEHRENLEQAIDQIDLLSINETELAELTGEKNLLTGVKQLHKNRTKYIIIKKGQHGAFLSHMKNNDEREHSLFYSPAFPIPLPADPTGAGDCFAGGFMGYIASEDEIDFKTMKQGLVYGSIMGSFSIEDFSIKKVQSLNDELIEERYNRLRDLVLI